MIKSRNKINVEMSSSSMSDLVFLLLIFFMITSTLISPNAVKLLLPTASNSKTMAKQNVTVYIDENQNYQVGDVPADSASLQSLIVSGIDTVQNACVVLRSDRTVPVQCVVTVIDAVNAINEQYGTQHKVILATASK
ncbi:MAG: biopolymer transporter ExbD [Bacteroidales bacterium]|nr:biopolymer transporter ExbD [Bacteroidales bacterium]